MKIKKVAVSILALTLIASAATANEGAINKIIPVNSINAAVVTRGISADGNWQYDDYGDTAWLVKYLGTDSNVIIPESIKSAKTNKSYAVTALNSGVFRNNTNITSVSVCRGITEIKRETFANAKNLKSVILPHGITKIDESAFSGTNIQSISLPSTVEEIAKNAFLDCPLTSITLHEGIKTIGTSAFENTQLTSIVFPASLIKIGTSAFANNKIKNLTVPASLKEIGNYAFENCSELSYVNLGNFSDNCIMGEFIFRGCNKLTNIYMNYSTFKIAAKYGALGGCKNLTSINNTTILKYTDDGKPYFASRYASVLNENFANPNAFIDKYLDAMVKYIVKTETAGCTSDAEKIRVLHDWVCNKVDYAYDENHNPVGGNEVHCDGSVFFRDTTVCEGYARALTLLYRAAGLDAFAVDGLPTANSSNRHMWTMVKLGDKYFHIDACHDDVEGKLYHYLKSDNDIMKCNSGHGAWTLDLSVGSQYPRDIPFPTPECEFSLGDANMDHVVDENDSVYISNIILGNEEVKDMTLTDINGDGVIDTLDAINVNYLIIPE